MALREEVILSIQRAQQQISQLESELSRASQPINVPVTVQGEEAITRLQTQLDAADETVDVRVQTFGLESADRTFAELSGSIDETRDRLQEAQAQADRLGDELATTGSRGATAFGTLRASIGPLIATFAAGLGLRELVGQFNAAVDSAIALNESLNAVNVVFGEGSQAIQDFGETSAQSVGLATSQVNQLVVPIGALLQNFGIEGREAADAALELTTRAADLASVFNTDVDEALQAIGSALRGEQEPIRRFGVNLDAASADARALELGLVGVGEEVSIAARGQANYSLLLEQTAFAAGDFANTADDAANRQRVLTAEFEEARAELGEALLPVFEDLLEVAPQLIDTLINAAPAIGDLAEQFVDLAIGAAGVVEPLAAIVTQVNEVSESDIDQVFDSFIDSVQGSEDTVGRTAERIGQLLGLFELPGFNRLDTAAAQFENFERVIRILGDDIDDGVPAIEALNDAFTSLTEQGVSFTVESLEALQDVSGATDDVFLQFVQALVGQRDSLNLTSDSVAALNFVMRELLELEGRGIPTFDGALVGFGDLDGARNIAATTEAIEGADRALLNLASGVDAVGDSQLPVIIRDFEDLAVAAEDAGVDVVDFVNNLPDDITLDLSGPELEVLSLIETLDGLETRLAELNEGQFANIELPELEFDSTGAVSNIDEVIAAIVNQAGEDATVEANLAEIIVGADAIDTAKFVDSLEPEVRAALAETFALDEAAAQTVQAALDGTMVGLGEGASEQLAETMAIATPQQLAALGVFAEENFVSQVIRNQIGGTAGEIAEILSTEIANSPNLVLDMADADVEGIRFRGQEIASELSQIISSNIRLDASLFNTEGTTGAPNTGTGTGGTPPPPPPVEVNVFNPTTEDLSTAVTQSAQIIGAVTGSLPRVQ